MTVETKSHDKAGGISSIEDLYRLYRRKLIHFFTGKGLEYEIAEDLSQEVFFRFLRCNKPIGGEDHARNLLYRIAQNLVIDYFRKHNGSVRVRALSPDDLADELPYMVAQEVGPEDRLIKDETSQDIRSAVSRLPLRYAQAIMLKEYDGLSYREIAAHMGVSQKAVESLLYRAKSQLKEDLAERGRKRGGWWSGILLGLRGIRERAVIKPLRALARAGWKLQSMPAGVGSAGLGKSVLNILAVILLVGSVASTGVAAAVFTGRETPAVELEAETVAAPTAGFGADEAVAAGNVAGKPALETARVEEREYGPVFAENVPVSEGGVPAVQDALLARTGDSLRDAITGAGSGLDLILADLGRLLGVLSDPLASLLFRVGVPPLLLETLVGLAGMEAARRLGSEVVDAAAEATCMLEEAAGLLPSLPHVELVGTVLPALAGEVGGGIAASEPPVPAAGGSAEALKTPAPAPGEQVAEPVAPQAGEDTAIVEEVTGGVIDLIDSVVDVVRGLFPR